MANAPWIHRLGGYGFGRVGDKMNPSKVRHRETLMGIWRERSRSEMIYDERAHWNIYDYVNFGRQHSEGISIGLEFGAG